jgi:hypothetical protein
MSPDSLRRTAALGTLAIAGLLSSSTFGAEACNRVCLQNFVDFYLNALVAKDPTKAPFSASVKNTENGQRLRPGDGLWKTVSGNSSYRLYFAEPAAGEVGFIGAIKELGLPVMLALRLKVARNQITEVESIVIRVKEGGFGNMAAFKNPSPLFSLTVPVADRLPREEMVRIANSYFTGLDEEDSGKNVPFDERCQRRENGVESARSSDPKASPMAKLGCKAQFDTGFSALVTDVRNRRFPIVDEERGLVYSVILFDHTGDVPFYRQPDGKEVPITGTFRRPLTFLIGELFQIEKGKIRQIEAAVLEVPYGMPAGWGE